MVQLLLQVSLNNSPPVTPATIRPGNNGKKLHQGLQDLFTHVCGSNTKLVYPQYVKIRAKLQVQDKEYDGDENSKCSKPGASSGNTLFSPDHEQAGNGQEDQCQCKSI